MTKQTESKIMRFEEYKIRRNTDLEAKRTHQNIVVADTLEVANKYTEQGYTLFSVVTVGQFNKLNFILIKDI
jgi:hypothetical protein